MNQVTQWLEQTLGLSPVLQGRIAATIAVILVLWLARRITLSLLWRSITDLKARYRARKVSLYTAVIIGLFAAGWVWFEGLTSLGTFFGLLSAGIAIALKDLLANLAGWAFIVWRRPFEVGDRIQIGTDAGDVIDLRIFQFTLLEIGNWVHADQSTGRIIHVPNGRVLTEVLANFTKGFQYIWNEIPVMITFESNWQKAKELLTNIINEHGGVPQDKAHRGVERASQRFLISYSTLTPIVYTSVADSGVVLTLRYLCNPRERRGSTQAIWEAILTAFGECDDIDFAYPTQRFYQNVTEGKSGARAEPPGMAAAGGPDVAGHRR